MFHDGKQFDVRVAEILDVRNELIAEFAVGEPAIVVLGDAAPGAEMDFVDGDGSFEPIFLGTFTHPGGIRPDIRVQIDDDGAGVGAQFGAESVGIGFQGEHVAVWTDDFVFVDGAFCEFGNEKSPRCRKNRGRAWDRHGHPSG